PMASGFRARVRAPDQLREEPTAELGGRRSRWPTRVQPVIATADAKISAGVLAVCPRGLIPVARGRQLRSSVRRRRLGERPGERDPDAAVRVGRDSGGTGELTEPASVGAHGKQLIAVPVRAEWIAGGVEDHRLGHRVLEDDPIIPVADSMHLKASLAEPWRTDR